MLSPMAAYKGVRVPQERMELLAILELLVRLDRLELLGLLAPQGLRVILVTRV